MLEHSNMASTGTRKRGRDPEDNCSVTLGGGSDLGFAADRTNNKRPRLSTPAPMWPIEDAAMSSMVTVEEGQLDSNIGNVSWQQDPSDITLMQKGVVTNSFAGLTSPPLSPAPNQGLALPTRRPHATPSYAITQRPAHDSGGPRIVRFDSELDGNDDDDEDEEPYDPEDVTSDIGAEDDDELDGEEVDVMGSIVNRGASSSIQPLSKINAFLHEIHFSNRRRRRDRLAPGRSALHVSRCALSATPSDAGSSTPKIMSPSTVLPRASLVIEEAAAVRRGSKLRTESSHAAPGKISRPPDEQSSASSQYEETNRLLGALFLSRRKRRDLAEHDAEL